MDEMETQGPRFPEQNGKLQKGRERGTRNNEHRGPGTANKTTCPERAADISREGCFSSDHDRKFWK